MNTTTIDVRTIPALGHREAMRLAATEYQRWADAAGGLDEDDWRRRTDNALWDVKAMAGHVVGMMEMAASVRQMIGQQLTAGKAAKRNGTLPIDELTGLQVARHADRSPAEVVARLAQTAPRAVRGRSRVPRVMRALPFDSGPPENEKWKLGYLLDVILTRDPWMHRVDLSQATGRPMVLTPEHDGRLITDVVAEWARRHGQPFTLTLTGPAGGTYASGTGGEHHELDAVEFCRILSGRGTGSGLLTTEVPF